MLSRIGFALTAAVIASGAVGCQNKVARERDDLYMQNRELQAKNDALMASRQAPPPPQQQPVMPPPQPAPAQPETVKPAPAAPPHIEGADTSTDPKTGNVTVNIASDVLFEPGKAEVRANSKKTLDQVAGVLNDQYNGKKIRVEGHTDSDPIRVSKWKSNQELSEARAKAVKDYLVSKGVNTSRIQTVGFGADKPRGQVKSSNRRVEIVVITK